MQSIWREETPWDSPTSSMLACQFLEYIRDLKKLQSITIPRSLCSTGSKQIFMFSDASEKAYCAAAYLRTIDDTGNIKCAFICAKTKVAPTQALTISKLELLAACLASELASKLANNMNIDMNNVHAFCDNTNVLCWLSRPAKTWKTFVCNRVAKIVKVLPFLQWHFVSTENNPADLGTRGISVKEFQDNLVWLNGPLFVYTSLPFNHHIIPNLDLQNALEKRKAQVISVLSVTVDYNFIQTFSSYSRLVHAVCYMYRWIFFKDKKYGAIDYSEFCHAEAAIFRISQKISFPSEIDRLKNKQHIKKKSSLVSLCPFLDKKGVMRVSGRLQNSPISEDKKHPIILHSKSHLSKLMVQMVHYKYFHAGRSFLDTFFSSRFWFVGGRSNLFKLVTRRCVTCARFRAKSCEQIMGQLPEHRVSISPPFTNTGVDFAGPFQCKCVKHRATRYYKVFIAIFVCFTTRAVHIEVVSDLSTPAFIEALKRFVAIRGLPSVLYSDNGTNFVGTRNLLLWDQKKLTEFATSSNFEWKFTPPVSPNFGGLWEAAVKSTKTHLVKTLSGQVLSLEEYNTLFAQIAAVLNSRPLCIRGEIEQDTEVITPGHFLTGRSLLHVPQLDSEDIPLSNRLLLMRNHLRGFWRVWSKDYLNQLQQRSKWKRQNKDLVPGQMVFVRSAKTKPFEWPIGVIVTVHPGPDKLVRVADVRFKDGVRTRSISSLVPLPVDTDLGSAGGACLG